MKQEVECLFNFSPFVSRRNSNGPARVARPRHRIRSVLSIEIGVRHLFSKRNGNETPSRKLSDPASSRQTKHWNGHGDWWPLLLAIYTVTRPTNMPKRSRDQPKSATTNDEVPCRDCRSLFASQVTLSCAMMDGCVPCAYKIGCFDVALDTSFCKQVLNQRPEQCCRSKRATADSSAAPGTLGYKPGMKVLTVGDGDFTFSLAIARIILPNGGNLYATSYERRETLSAVYPAIDETIQELERLGAFVHFEVDATRLADTLPALTLKGQIFDRIVWNFPCTAVAKGQDGQNQEMENNKRLVRAFVGNARFLLAEKGEIHINHKTKVRTSMSSCTKVYDTSIARPSSLCRQDYESLISHPSSLSPNFSLLSTNGRLKMPHSRIVKKVQRLATVVESFWIASCCHRTRLARHLTAKAFRCMTHAHTSLPWQAEFRQAHLRTLW